MERSVSDFGLLRGQSAEDDKEGKRRPKRTPETPTSSITRGCDDEANSERADTDGEVAETNEAAGDRI